MQLIIKPPIPFHTLCIDFILCLSESPEGLDEAMSLTCKFMKRRSFIAGKKTWMAKEWGNALPKALAERDMGFPHEIICDRDPKFLSVLFKAMFR